MRAGRLRGWTGGAALVLALARPLVAAEELEVRVLSGAGPQPVSTVTLRARPDVAIEDRTTGAKPAAERRGPASTGETFTGELTLFLPGFAVSRPAAIEVGDPVVSAVRLFPEAGGTTVTLFVRQPVTYSVSRPSAIGEIRIELRGKTRAVIVRPSLRRSGRPSIARPKVTGEPQVAVDAEFLSYDKPTNTLTARGGVTLTRADTVLTADEVVYDRTNSIAEAKGHVVVTDPQATVTGDFAHLNLEDESGWIENSTASLEPSKYRLEAGRIDKLGGPLYSVRDGVFTTCECGGLERPSWSILGGKTDVKLSGAGYVRNAFFRVKDVPVLWFPWFAFPANNNRQSGFLMPRVGYSSTLGFKYEQGFYWAINKSSDATVAVDVETLARVGVIGEYRYVLSKEARGDFTAAYYNEAIRTKPTGVQTSAATVEEPQNRFAFFGNHHQSFYGGSKLYGELFAVSDNTFLHDINSFSFGGQQAWVLRSARYTTSQAGIYRPWRDGLLWLDNTYHQDLIDPQSFAFQRLPRIEAEHSQALLGDRLVGRVDAEAVNYHRDTGFKGFRGDVAPELFLPFQLGRVVHGSFTGQLRETAYHLTDRQQVGLVVPDFPGTSSFQRASELPQLAANRTRELAEFNGRTGSEFERVYDFHHLGLEKLKHTIEPELQYLFIPQVGRPTFTTQLPACNRVLRPSPGVNCLATVFTEGFLFDERDAINRRNFISGGVTSRLLGRWPTPAEAQEEAVEKAAEKAREEGEEEPPAPGAPPSAPPRGPARELLRVSLLQGYDVSRALVGASHASDLDVNVRMNPLAYLALGYDGTIGVEDRSVRGLATYMTVREPSWVARPIREYQGPSSLTIGYRFIEPNVNADIDPTSPESRLLHTAGVNEIDTSLYLRLGAYAGLAFISRYDLSTTPQPPNPPLGPHFLERDYLIRLISRCQCWIFEAGVTERINPDQPPLFRAQLTLVGLGSFGQAPLQRAGLGFGSPAYRSAARAGLGGMY